MADINKLVLEKISLKGAALLGSGALIGGAGVHQYHKFRKKLKNKLKKEIESDRSPQYSDD